MWNAGAAFRFSLKIRFLLHTKLLKKDNSANVPYKSRLLPCRDVRLQKFFWSEKAVSRMFLMRV